MQRPNSDVGYCTDNFKCCVRSSIERGLQLMFEIDIDDQDVQLLRQHADLFPSDPFAAHVAPEGRQFEEVMAEKRAIHSSMVDAAKEFSGPSRELVEVTADLGILFHHNQFRSGFNKLHYSSHIAEVGYRAGAVVMSRARLLCSYMMHRVKFWIQKLLLLR